MKRVVLDLRVLDQPEMTGVARYASCLAPLLLGRQTADYRFLGAAAVGPLERYAGRRFGVELPENDDGTATKLLALVCHLERADLLFSPYHPVPERRTCRAALMIHDLLPLRHPEWFAPRTYAFFDGPLRRSADRATRILVNSAWTKREVMDLYGIAARKIAVVPLAAADVFRRCGARTEWSDRDAIAALGVRRPYVLAAATREPRKNLSGVREAYALVRRQFDVGLVVAGRYGWKTGDVLDPLLHGPLQDSVVVTGHVTDEQLAILYHQAEAFVYPSFCEGFGLPVLEAMAAGAPVVTTAGGALPEVAGDAAVYCVPEDAGSIARAVAGILSNRGFRDELVTRGLARTGEFSWHRTADGTHAELLACFES